MADDKHLKSSGSNLPPTGPGDDFTPLGAGVESESAKKKVSGAKTKGGGGRKKVTKQEAEEMIADWKAQRDDKRRERIAKRAPKESLIRNGVSLALIVASIGSFIYLTTTAGGYEDQTAQNNETIAKLQGEINEVSKRTDSIPDAEVMVAGIEDSHQRGKELAALLNEIAGFDVPDDPTDERIEDYQALFDDLKGFFTNNALNGGSFNPVNIWYQPHVSNPDPDAGGTVKMPKEMWEWVAVPTQSARGDGLVDTLFEARRIGGDDDGKVMAWATAVYDPKVRKFNSVVMAVTSTGQGYIGVTDTRGNLESQERDRRQEVLDKALQDAQARGLQVGEPEEGDKPDNPAQGENEAEAKPDDVKPEGDKPAPAPANRGENKPDKPAGQGQKPIEQRRAPYPGTNGDYEEGARR